MKHSNLFRRCNAGQSQHRRKQLLARQRVNRTKSIFGHGHGDLHDNIWLAMALVMVIEVTDAANYALSATSKPR